VTENDENGGAGEHDAEIIDLFHRVRREQSEAFDTWHADLDADMADQPLTESLCDVEFGESPWPARDNPMVAYLIDLGLEVVAAHDERTALEWIVLHAWLEGSLEARCAVIGTVFGDA
jgi:hypothetical protein